MPTELARSESPEQVLALIHRVRADLGAVQEPREAVQIVQQADAIRYLTEKADASQEVQNQAAEVALRARRRAGELLAETVHRGGGDGGGAKSQLASLGVDKDDSSRWQQLARLPEDDFEEYVSETLEEGGELTTAGALRLAPKSEPKQPKKQEDRWTCLACEGRGYLTRDPEAGRGHPPGPPTWRGRGSAK